MQLNENLLKKQCTINDCTHRYQIIGFKSKNGSTMIRVRRIDICDIFGKLVKREDINQIF